MEEDMLIVKVLEEIDNLTYEKFQKLYNLSEGHSQNGFDITIEKEYDKEIEINTNLVKTFINGRNLSFSAEHKLQVLPNQFKKKFNSLLPHHQ